MKKHIRIFLSLFFCIFAMSCASEKIYPTGDLSTKTEEVSIGEIDIKPEKIEGKIDTYIAIARATKYNISKEFQLDLEKQKKYSTSDKASSDKLIKEIYQEGEENKHQLYDQLRILDFATSFANSSLLEGNEIARDNIYENSTQNLTLIAIIKHKDVLFAHKEIKNISKITEKEQKKINAYNKKFEKKGTLEEKELEHKKNLEVMSLKFEHLKEKLILDTVEYSTLIKAGENEKISVEGKMFYELDDFDKSFSPTNFKQLALKNREEFINFVIFDKKFELNEVENLSIRAFPEMDRLKINGKNFKDEAYISAMKNKTKKITDELLSSSKEYNTKKDDARIKQRESLMEQVSVAVFTQIDLAYNLVHIHDTSILELTTGLNTAKANLKKIKKDDDINILKKQLEIIKLEYEISETKADRALAIRALYFYSGFSIDKYLLDDSIKNIAKKLREEFNKNMIESLAEEDRVSNAFKKKTQETDNSWARQDRWLEKLVDNKGDVGALPPPPAQKKHDSYIKNLESSSENYTKHYDSSHNDKTIMQLGAYKNIENANNFWSKVYNSYPEARNLIPEMETIETNGEELHRLIIKSPTGNLTDLCNKIRFDGFDCILK